MRTVLGVAEAKPLVSGTVLSALREPLLYYVLQISTQSLTSTAVRDNACALLR